LKSFKAAGQLTNLLPALISVEVDESSDAKSAKRSFASKTKIFDILTQSFASGFLLRFTN
jgi:hypothetical protein